MPGPERIAHRPATNRPSSVEQLVRAALGGTDVAAATALLGQLQGLLPNDPKLKGGLNELIAAGLPMASGLGQLVNEALKLLPKP